MLHHISVMDNNLQGSWGHLGAFASPVAFASTTAGGPCPASAFSLVPTQPGLNAKDGVDVQAQTEAMNQQVHLAQPVGQPGFFLAPQLVQAHLPTHSIPVMDPSRQAMMMAHSSAMALNPALYQRPGFDMFGLNQYGLFPQIKQEPGLLGQFPGGVGALSLAGTPSLKDAQDMLHMQSQLQNAQMAALGASNFVQVFDGPKVVASNEQQISSENQSPEPKSHPGARVPRWKRRNNVKHVAGERARRARTSNKVKVIRGLLPQLSANASFNDMVQMIIDIAKESAAHVKKEEQKSGRKEPETAGGRPVVQCSDHRSMIRGCGLVPLLLIDRENKIVEGNAALVKNVQGDLHDSRERLVGEHFSTVIQAEHAEALAGEIATHRAAIQSAQKKAQEETKEDGEEAKKADDMPETVHFVRRGVMCKAGPARGDGNLKPLSAVDAHVTVTARSALVLLMSSDGIADCSPAATMKAAPA